MEHVNWWRLLPYEAISLAALVALSLVKAEPGRRREFVTIAVATWGVLLFGFVITAGAMGGFS